MFDDTVRRVPVCRRWPGHVLVALLALLAAVALAACGGDGEDSAASATRTITHAMGTTEVPETPSGVVVLDSPELDAALALGVTPVGAVRSPVATDLPSYLRDRLEGIEDVGTIESPNLEAITALDPDLILSSKVRHEALYDELSAIAPTVFADTPGFAWKDNLQLYAEALGKADEAAEQLAAYEERARGIGARLGDPAETTVGVMRFLPDEIRLYSPRSFIGTVLADVGVSRPAAVADTQDIAINISLEQIARADADVVYVTTYGPAKDTPQARGGGLMQRLGAAKAGRLFPVDDDIWMLGIGLLGASRVLDDLERTLVA
jgi:iron complex transport system substrate-binding protein